MLDDENASLNLNGTINIASKIPTFNFLAEAKHVRPHTLNLTPKYKDAEFSVKLKADFTGGSIDEMNGEINIDSLQFISPEQSYLMEKRSIPKTILVLICISTIQNYFQKFLDFHLLSIPTPH